MRRKLVRYGCGLGMEDVGGEWWGGMGLRLGNARWVDMRVRVCARAHVDCWSVHDVGWS